VLTVALGVCTLTLTACAAAPSELRGSFEASGLPSVDVRIEIQGERRGESARYQHAAFVAIRILGEWLVPFPDSTLTLIDPPFRVERVSPPVGAVVLDRVHWWTARAAMAPELSVARAVSRRYWERVIDVGALPSWFVGGLVEYSARRIVARLSDEQFFSPFRSRAEERFFTGFVPRDTRVPLRPEDEGDPVPAYRMNPRSVTPRTREARMLLALGTLERWIGRPTFDSVLLAFVQTSSGGRPTIADFRRVASATSQQDLSWLFEEAFDGSGVFDYAVSNIESAAQSDGRYRTTVVVRRVGDATFSGAGKSSSAAFERGRGITVLTSFADRDSIRDSWDGRGREKRFEYLGPAPVVSAQLDPDRVLLLDLNQTNNSRTLAPVSGTAGTRWAGRWLLWMEDALLTYASLL
jgi:hypothetical protein